MLDDKEIKKNDIKKLITKSKCEGLSNYEKKELQELIVSPRKKLRA